MKLHIGGNYLMDVKIPLLWGQRAVIQDKQTRVSVIDLGSGEAILEILGDQPAKGIKARNTESGFEVIRDGEPLYNYSPNEKLLASIGLRLPQVRITPAGVWIGTNYIEGSMVVGSPVGIHVTEDGFSIGSPLPEGLAELVV